MKKILLSLAVVLGMAAMANAQDYKHSVGAVVGNMYGVSYKGFIFGVDGLALQADLGVKLSNFGKNFTQTTKVDQTIDGTSQAGFPVSATTSYPVSGAVNPPSYDYFTFELNPNIVYQMAIKEFGFGKLSWYAGGGISLGMMKAGASGKYYWDDKGAAHNFWWAMSQRIDHYNSITGAKEGTEEYVPSQFKFGFNAVAGLELSLSNAPIVLGFDFRPGYGLGAFSTSDKATTALGEVKDKTSCTTSFFDWTLAASVRYRF